MPTLFASSVIDAPAARVYGVLVDYRGTHQRILPKFFIGLDVEEGGVGAGTVFTARSRALGVEQSLRMTVSEPEPGRVLVESDPVLNLATTFTVDPIAGGKARVAIATTWPGQGGIAGVFERLIMPWYLRRVYEEELELLAAECRRRSGDH